MGVPTAFVRTTGCHLRCSWCDATYTFTGGHDESVDEVVAWVEKQGLPDVCLTGGEPLLQKQAWDLVGRLLDGGHRIVLETAGNLDFTAADDHAARDRLCVSMDIKCPSSGEHAKNTPERLHTLRPSDQLKFVIADEADYDFACRTLAEQCDDGARPPPCPVYFNPVGGVDPAWLTKAVLASPPPVPVHVGVQLHKLVWGDKPGH